MSAARSPRSTHATSPGSTTVVTAERCLVLAPHFDDEVLGCGGLVALLTGAAALVEPGTADGKGDDIAGRDPGSAPEPAGRVRVMFLSDGSGGVEQIADRAAYAAQRRLEATAAAAVLGVAADDLVMLELPDGQLEHHRVAIAAAVERELLGWRPDLLLVPSPLEVSTDHRAAFAALHEVLGAIRPDDLLLAGPGAALREVAAGLTVLAYEVNHPAYPDVLVDVTAQESILSRAMAAYPSQEERHGYLAAALGLRRYRCLSLGPSVRSAEAYRRLTWTDFATRSPAALIAHLGGQPALLELTEGPLLSVVVRTRDRPRLLAEALASLAAQSYRRVELVLVNDGGAIPLVPSDFPFAVRRVEQPSPSGRAAAANAGIAAASGEWVCFLDDDDLAYPEHLATLARAAGSQDAAGVVYSDAAVVVYQTSADGGWEEVERRLPYSRDFDPDLLLLDNYIPFNTVAVRRELLAEVGPLLVELPFFEDWELLIRLAARSRFQHLRATTCEYRHFRGGGHIFGEVPRDRPDFLAMKAAVLSRHASRLTPDRLSRAVDRLRAELVGHAEAAASRERGLHELQSVHRALADTSNQLSGRYQELSERYWQREEAFHRLNGERSALADERTRLSLALAATQSELGQLRAIEHDLRQANSGYAAEVARLQGEEARLDRAVRELTRSLETAGNREVDLRAEIARLGELIATMETTRAWRLHRTLERWRGRGDASAAGGVAPR